ncbi:MAG: cation:proton antiporter [Acidobacteriota bacterium]
MLDRLLHESLILFGSAVVVLLVAARLRVPPILALLLTGMVIGPTGLGWVAHADEVEAFAEIGVALLLFAIGLELSLARLRELKRIFLVGGGSQTGITLLAAAGIAALLGFAPPNAIFYGCVIALSSTAIVLKLLDERREGDTPHGQVALGILLFQDFLIVPLIVLTPVLAGTVPLSFGDLALRFGGALLLIGLVVLLARKVAPWVLLGLARSGARETFVLGALVACLGMSWLTHALGFSLALGAFLAGLIVSETEYSHQVVADVTPFRDLFASLFFISIGMLVDLDFFVASWPQVVGLAFGILVLKGSIAGGATALSGFPHRTRLLAGVALCQVGEFSFVLMEVGRQNGLLLGGRFQLLLAAAVLTMLATPLLLELASRFGARIPARGIETAADAAQTARSGHVVIVGYGSGGRLVRRALAEAHIDHAALELNADLVRRARADGVDIEFGDATRADLLLHVGVDRARVVVFELSDPVALHLAVRTTRELAPHAEIIVRTRRAEDIEALQALGADKVIAESFETAIEIFTRVLERYHVPRNLIRAQTRVLRGEGYAMLRAPAVGAGVSETVLDVLAAGTTDIYRLEPESPAVGRSLRDLDLRRLAGASVIAVVRDETPFPNPSATLALEAGDCLVLVGSHAELDRAFDALRPPLPPEVQQALSTDDGAMRGL